jgi:hypothetical protein
MFPITKNYTQGQVDTFINAHKPSKIKHLFLTSTPHSPRALRGHDSYQLRLFQALFFKDRLREYIQE